MDEPMSEQRPLMNLNNSASQYIDTFDDAGSSNMDQICFLTQANNIKEEQDYNYNMFD